jgi:glyoxylase-like metal-dependent hydrolase (beta-lactamase superfamily II)
MEKLTERIYYMPYHQETDRPNLGYVKGEKYSLMIDAGNSKKHVELFMKELDELHLPHPNFVGITHWHWDHCYGMHAIPAISIACTRTNELLKRMANWSWNEEEMEARVLRGEDIRFCTDMIQLEYPDRDAITIISADITFEDNLNVDLGNITCEILRVGGSHSEDSVIYYIPEEKVVFLGDCDCEDLHHGDRKYYPELLQMLYDKLNALDFTTCVPGHWIPHSKEELLSDLKEELQKLY